MKRTHIDLFDDNSWGWTLSDAQIAGGILDITVASGYGQRSPNADWFSGSSDDFIVEADFKLGVLNVNANIFIVLVGDAQQIRFYNDGAANLMRIYYNGVARASQAYVEDTNWHTAKIRRVGTIFYFSIDAGAEISWDYGIARALNYIQFIMSGVGNTGDFDNFKYSWIEIGTGVGVGNPLIL